MVLVLKTNLYFIYHGFKSHLILKIKNNYKKVKMEKKTLLNQYLIEIKYRFYYILISFFLTFLITFCYIDTILYILAKPLFKIDILNQTSSYFIYTHITEVLSMSFKNALLITFFLNIPILYIQFYEFLKSNLTKYEKILIKYLLIGSIFFGTLSFLISYNFILPSTWQFFQNFTKTMTIPLFFEAHINLYIDFLLKFILYIGLSFQTPLILFFLIKLNILSLSSIFWSRKIWYLITCFFIILFLPPDFLSQAILIFNFVCFFELGLLYLTLLTTYKKKLEITGLEPITKCLQSTRSTN